MRHITQQGSFRNQPAHRQVHSTSATDIMLKQLPMAHHKWTMVFYPDAACNLWLKVRKSEGTWHYAPIVLLWKLRASVFHIRVCNIYGKTGFGMQRISET